MDNFENFFAMNSSSISDESYDTMFGGYDIDASSSRSQPEDLMDVDKDTATANSSDIPEDVVLDAAGSPDEGIFDDIATANEEKFASTTTLDDDKPHSNHDEEDPLDHRKFKFQSYNLRPTDARNGKSVWITWLDSDTSGTYDPKRPGDEERMGRSRRRSFQNRRHDSSSPVQHSKIYSSEHETDGEDEETEPTAARLSRLAARQKGVSLTVTFDLTSTALQNLAQKIPDTWPGDNHNILSDEHYRFLADQLNSRADGWKPYNLRRRNSAPSDYGDTDSEDNLFLAEGRIPDPLPDDPDQKHYKQVDLRNHPVARGCKSCRAIKVDCSLLHDEFSWPCDFCAEDGECELLTAPEKRKTCEYYHSRKLPCSYTSLSTDPCKPCNECASLGYACVAGPDPRTIRERIRYEKDYSKPPEPMEDDRKYVTCTECRREKKNCSLKKKMDMPPCKTCQDAGIPCTFEALRRNRSTSNVRKTAGKDKKSAREAHIITTALNHPIHFLHAEDDECTWCTRNIGIFGRGMREVLVKPSADGLSYAEIEGGENTSGQYDDHMCIRCTMERCRIVGCIEHELRPIDGIDSDKLDVGDMLQRVASGEKPLPTDRWCAVCPGPAVYYCCTPQECDMWGQELDPRSAEAEGCGLILCEDCAVLFGDHDNLEQIIDAAAVAPDIWILGVRADAEFLKKEGLLVKNVMGPTASAAETMNTD